MLIREARILLILMMRVPAATLAFVAVFVLCSTVAADQPAQGVVRGEVTDSSGGVLPGVTVVATATGGRLLATAVTDGSGGYVFRALPAGPITLTFQLEGFASAAVRLTVQPGAASRVVERLGLAPFSETVVVHAPSPVDPPSRLVSPPPPVVRPVPAHDRDSICGPAKPVALPESLGTIRSGRYETQTGLYTTGAELVIDGGLLDGLEVGRNLIVRRYYRVWGATNADAVAEHSAGLLQIVAAGERSSAAVVVYACDELRKGDFLASFKPEPIRAPDPLGTPAYYDAARILFADEGQTLGAPRRLMVIDRGTEHGTRVGQRFTLFRQGHGRAKRDVVGDATVVAVRTGSATIRVDRVTDAISPGDWAAPQTASSVARQQR
jgi:Carboxypeptidase regulatory-like domain